MATPKQIEANRANALRSTGPRTLEGKAKVRLNSLVHGLRSQEVLLAGEDRQAFEDLRQAFLDKYQPAGPDELYCVERMLSAYWRSRRIPTIEARLFNNNQAAVTIAFTQDPAAWDGFTRLSRYETSLDRVFYRALNELTRLKGATPVAAPAAGLSADPPPPPPPDPAPDTEIGFARQNTAAPAEPMVPPPPKKRYELAPNGKWRELPPKETSQAFVTRPTSDTSVATDL
jgi:hypothetical protein